MRKKKIMNLKGSLIKEIFDLKYINSDLTERAIVEGNFLEFFKGCSKSDDEGWKDFYKYLIKKNDSAIFGNRLENIIKLIWANPVRITNDNVYTVDGFKWSRGRTIFVYYKLKNGIRIYKNKYDSIDKFDTVNKKWIFE